MARLARIVVPHIPHHVTQRGNRREPIFFKDGDHDVYRDLMGVQLRKAGIEIWAYCLMPNHVHLILTPRHAGKLGEAVGEAHRRYTNFVNARGGWTGHLFQSRFSSVAMDETHLKAAVCYVSLNPVRAGLTDHAEDWPWSSARAHLSGLDDSLVSVQPILDRMPDLAELLKQDHEGEFEKLRRSEATGRPVGTEEFVLALEKLLKRPIARRSPGRKPAAASQREQLSLTY
jgi:putative transposase